MFIGVPFNKPFMSGNEIKYILQSVNNGKLSGNGKYTQLCQKYFENRYKYSKCLLTSSCTDALEMAAILLNIVEGDEVIIPSFTFVSTANAFVLRGAKIVFADSMQSNPNIDAENLENLISERTKAIVVVHYAGISCEMGKIMEIASKYDLFVVEDAAQAIDSFFIDHKGEKRPLGGIGHLSAFSFHETKNIISGEGGMLVINDDRFLKRSEIIWEKGTNRSAFFRGEIDKYGWVDIGSSFLPSEIVSAFLFAQIENLDKIQNKRKLIWNRYYSNLTTLKNSEYIQIPNIPNYATNNAHMFYIVCKDAIIRDFLIEELKSNKIHAVFHYMSLHKSNYYNSKHDGRILPNSDRFSETLIRLPMFYELTENEIDRITSVIIEKISGL